MHASIVSLDMACTLFWEPGCDGRNPYRQARVALQEVLKMIAGEGYSIRSDMDPYEEYWHIWRETWRRGPRRELWHRYILAKLLYRLGAQIDHVVLDKAYSLLISKRAESFILPRKHRQLLEELRARGYRIILTTGTGAHDLILEILRQNNATRYFDMVFSTQLVGIPKSDHRFYEEIIDTLGVEPWEITHTGDSLEYDVRPAEKTGIKTIYYGWRTLCRPADNTPCILSLSELPGYLL